jgi:hypothetical protein
MAVLLYPLSACEQPLSQPHASTEASPGPTGTPGWGLKMGSSLPLLTGSGPILGASPQGNCLDISNVVKSLPATHILIASQWLSCRTAGSSAGFWAGAGCVYLVSADPGATSLEPPISQATLGTTTGSCRLA